MIAIVERASLDAMGVGCDQAEQIEARRWFFCDTPSPEGLTAHRVFSFLELDLTDYRSSLWAAMLYRRSPLAQKVVSHQRVRAYRNIKLKKNRNSELCIK